MNFLRQKLAAAPEYARIAPFAVYALLGWMGKSGGATPYWVYVVKTLLAAWVLWEARPLLEELQWKFSWEALVIGVAVFVAWVGLDGLYPRLSDPGAGSNPHTQFGQGSALAWFMAIFHLLGSTIVVPPAEELFYRSFLYRYFVKLDFQKMPLGKFHGLSFVVTSVLFGLMHPDRWLAGILCGLAYQGLAVYKNRLGDAIVAHALTNFLLSLWVIYKGAWSFW
jgi:CAAX prenyl protease-like protein